MEGSHGEINYVLKWSVCTSRLGSNINAGWRTTRTRLLNEVRVATGVDVVASINVRNKVA